jgi:hypothetical protein
VRCHLTPHLHHHPTVVVEWFQSVAAFHGITPYRYKMLLLSPPLAAFFFFSLCPHHCCCYLLPFRHIWSHAASLEEWHGRDKAGGSSTSVVSGCLSKQEVPSR